jgi:hypothetical protein
MKTNPWVARFKQLSTSPQSFSLPIRSPPEYEVKVPRKITHLESTQYDDQHVGEAER